MANQYYDFNPSATTWVLLMGGMVLFVLALAGLLIVMVYRSEASGAVGASGAVPAPGRLPVADPGVDPSVRAADVPTLDHPAARAS